jgi:hypothetical protein
LKVDLERKSVAGEIRVRRVGVADRIRQLLKRSLMVDLRNIYRPEEMAAVGLTHVSVGRPEVGTR